MNPKIFAAFVAGALLASGLVYLAVRPDGAAKPTPAMVIDPAGPATAAHEAEPAPAVSPTETRVPDAPMARDTYRPKAKNTKPSPTPTRQLNQDYSRVIAPPAAPTQPSQETKQPEAVAPVTPPPPAEPRVEPPPPPQPHSVTVTAGTTLQVRVGETLTTQKNQPGDSFLATLAQPLVVDGFVIAERGARAEGRIVEVDRGGKVKGVSRLTVELTKLTTADGQHVRVRTASFNKDGESATKKDAAKVGIGAALGAAIGAIAGGGKGAGIGAGVGGAAGAGDVLLTRGPDAVIPVETRLSFRLEEPITITEKLR